MRPRAHNLISYSLALLVFLAVAVFRVRGAGSVDLTSELGRLAGAAMWSVHFLRRAGESAWLHRYAKPRVVPGDAFIEYLYYWGFAAWNAAALFSSGYHSPGAIWIALGGAVFALGELGNAKAHRMLRDLRPPGSSGRQLPRGFLFERVSCPHYLFEIISWIGFAIATRTWAAAAFVLLGAAILAAWARARHVAYRTEFDGQSGRDLYPQERRALIPGVF